MVKGSTATNKKTAPGGAISAPVTGSIAHMIGLLPQLNQQDLRALQTAIEQELDKHISIDRDLFHLVFDIVGEKPMAISKFSNSPNGAIWRKNISYFHDLVSKLLSDETPRKPVLYALHRLLLELLVTDIKDQGLPVTLKQICLHLGVIEAVFDRNFPMYLNSGLGHLIMAKLGGKHGL